MKAIVDLLNGNLTDAKRAARNRSFISIANACTEEYGMSFEESHYTAAYLKGEISFQQYCQERHALTLN
jgi:hypothetical protein